MFGKGAGSLPTASSILSDVMARQHGYRYEYKKMGYSGKPEYSTEPTLKVYVRYHTTDIPTLLPFRKITERFVSENGNYVIGEIKLADLIRGREALEAEDVFIVNIPVFFTHLDN